MVEMIVVAGVLSALFIGTWCLGKFHDIQSSTIQAARYAAWERTARAPGFSNTQLESQTRARMRALETGRWVIHASNTGVTALIDRDGLVRDALPPNETGYLDGQVDLFEGSTPFMSAHNRPLIALSILFILIASYRRFLCISASGTTQSATTPTDSEARNPH